VLFLTDEPGGPRMAHKHIPIPIRRNKPKTVSVDGPCFIRAKFPKNRGDRIVLHIYTPEGISVRHIEIPLDKR
jgi:hypothetical protein